MTTRLWCGVLTLLVAGASLVAVTPATAQDAHYWTLQYGPRSALLGGAVIGSVDDVSATYYNPGAIALASDLAFAVSTDVFEYAAITLEDGGGEGVDLGTTKSGLRPSMVAGTISRDLFGGSGILAYSALTRSRGTQDLAGIVLLATEDLPPDAGLSDAVGSLEFNGQYNDFWGGLTYAQDLGEHFGLGVTWYGAIRSQRRDQKSSAALVSDEGSGVSEVDNSGGKYTALRTLFKLGASFKAGAVTGGATLTTPSIHISGGGELDVFRSTIGADTTALLAAVQTDLPAEYRSPLSIGAGAAWRIGAARLHGSLEWFDSVDPYVVIQGTEIQAQVPGTETLVLNAVHEQASVTNWGLGLEYALNEKTSGYISFYTDDSNLDDEIERAGLSALPIDIRTVTVGMDFVLRSALITLGVGYGWGSELDQTLTDVLRQEDEDFEATYVYRGIKLLFGFEVGLG
ncbi:MAG: hypothetical protein M8861_06320 [marine benthic group bacterium]|nr:hypothetical protein [Gemmatimonadota bacterium]